MAEAVREIADRAAEHAADRRRRQPVPRLDPPQEDQQQHDRQQPRPEEEALAELLRQRRQEAEGAPRIANVGQVEEARDDGQLLTVGKSVQDPLLGPLIDGEGQREDGDEELHFQGDLGHRRRAYHEASARPTRGPGSRPFASGAPWEKSRARTARSAVEPAGKPDWRPAPSSWAARDATTKLARWIDRGRRRSERTRRASGRGALEEPAHEGRAEGDPRPRRPPQRADPRRQLGPRLREHGAGRLRRESADDPRRPVRDRRPPARLRHRDARGGPPFFPLEPDLERSPRQLARRLSGLRRSRFPTATIISSTTPIPAPPPTPMSR